MFYTFFPRSQKVTQLYGHLALWVKEVTILPRFVAIDIVVVEK